MTLTEQKATDADAIVAVEKYLNTVYPQWDFFPGLAQFVEQVTTAAKGLGTFNRMNLINLPHGTNTLAVWNTVMGRGEKRQLDAVNDPSLSDRLSTAEAERQAALNTLDEAVGVKVWQERGFEMTMVVVGG